MAGPTATAGLGYTMRLRYFIAPASGGRAASEARSEAKNAPRHPFPFNGILGFP